ncbi:MAG: hypothetical protein IPM82_12030 [Saprospiraceae bacterium]|nr:hypothetical protein [Saprospiraceae bacterium]
MKAAYVKMHPQLFPFHRFRPKLKSSPLTVANEKKFQKDFASKSKTVAAIELIQQSPREALPTISLIDASAQDLEGAPGSPPDSTVESLPDVEKWMPQWDLLNSVFNKKEFVVETESEGTSFLRFGDNLQGERPDEGMDFKATYRIGNGSQGNVGTGALAHIVPSVATSLEVDSVSNPIPAQGGTDPESMEEVRQFAPEAFRTQERAVTPADYEEFAKKPL